jgi:hypothetical protein
MSAQAKLTTGTFGSFHTGVNEQTGEFASVRIIDAPELESKIAVVVTKQLGYNPETTASPISDVMWDYIKGEGMKAARLDGVDIAKQPFHQYIAREYWEIIK